MKIKDNSVLAELGLVFITIIWGSAFVVVKNTTASVSPNYIIAIRFGIAAVLMPIFFYKHLKKIDSYSIKSGVVLGVLLYAAYYLQTVGIKFTTAGNNAFLTAIYVVIVPFLYWLVKSKKPDIYNIVSAFICITGIGFLSLHSGFTVNIGDTLSLLCGIVFSAQIVCISILTEKINPILLSFTQFAVTTLLALAVAIFTESAPTKLGSDSLLGLLYIGIFSTMIALIMQNVCQKYVPPAKASLIMSLESLFGTFFGIVFLNEVLTFKTFVGFLLIFSAIVISETKLSFLKRKKDEPVAEESDALS